MRRVVEIEVHFVMKSATTLRARQRALDLPIELDTAIRNQNSRVHAALRAAIVEGRLQAGTQLPSSRDLAEQLGVRRNAIVAAYEHLVSDGLLEARHGAGTYVSRYIQAPQAAPRPLATSFAPPRRRPFALGHTFVDDDLLRRLGGYLRHHVVTAGTEEIGYGDPRGSAQLREQIAQHLAVHRGVRCDPECIVIVSGTQHALRLCVEALLMRGDAIWMENPGYYATQFTLRTAGMKLIPVPVDDEGIDVAAGLRTKAKARAAYVTPSHQFPSGVTMSMRRRIALIDWARATDSWIIEDDYDSEYRFAGPPLTALAGIGGERVIYIGTFTKILFAGLRLAYMVLPAEIATRVIAIRASVDRFPPRFMQDAVAALMADGTLARHTRRMRTRYREARDVVVTALGEAAGDAIELYGPAQGLHLVARLPDGISTDQAMYIRDLANVDAKLLSETQITAGGPEGFILGYSGHPVEELRAAALRLGRAAVEAVGKRRRPHAKR
jgi:GntR family transcriptional regulator/MocR family aminotransferase